MLLLLKPKGSVVAERLTPRTLDVEVWVPALQSRLSSRLALLFVGPDGLMGHSVHVQNVFKTILFLSKFETSLKGKP